MKAIKVFEQEGNRTVGIFQREDGSYCAMTFSASKDFKTIKSAEKWIAKFGY